MTASSNKADRMYIQRILEETTILRNLSSDDLIEFTRVARTVAIEKSKSLMAPKGANEEIYIIGTGVVGAIQYNTNGGKGVLVALYGPGEMLGLEKSILSRTTNEIKPEIEFRLLSNISVIALPAADFMRIFRRSQELTLATLQSLSEKLNDMRMLFASTLHSPLEIRLAALFSRISDYIGDEWQPTVNIGKLAQSTIAEMLGVTREHINRTLTMWERSGLVFQAKNGDIVIENRKRLSNLAKSRQSAATPSGDNEWLWEIDAHLDYGLYVEAHDLAIEAAKRSPKDKRFKHRAVIATARSGATTEALNLIETFKLSEDYADEELACLRPRLLRDLAYSNGADEPAQKPLALSAKEYLKTFKGSGGTYSGVNAASTYAMLGELEKASTIAEEVIELTEEQLFDLDEDETDYWRQCTIGECRVITQNFDRASLQFKNACATNDVTPGKKAQTRRQLRRLSSRLPIDEAWINQNIPQSNVLFFSGPMAPKDKERHRDCLHTIDRNIQEFLSEHDVGSACGALAAGADIIIAERLLEHGAQLHIYLPVSPKDFIKSSVEPFGDEWRSRFITCMKSASTIDWNRKALPCNAAYNLGAIAAMGRTIRHANELQADAIGFFVTKTDIGAKNSISSKSARHWNNLGLKAFSFSQTWSSSQAQSTKPENEKVVFAVILTLSTLPGLPAKIKRLITSSSTDAKRKVTIIGFDTLDAAIQAAKICQAKSPSEARIWLDIGILKSDTDTPTPEYFVTSASRPITDPNKIYTSDVFAHAALALGHQQESFDYIGYTQVEEKVEPCPLYLLSI